jgi:hypothetical protein
VKIYSDELHLLHYMRGSFGILDFVQLFTRHSQLYVRFLRRFVTRFPCCSTVSQYVGDETRPTKRRNRRRRRKHKLARTCEKLRNVVRHDHIGAVNALLSHYDDVMIPSFGTSRMVRCVSDDGTRRLIRKKTARAMSSMAHYTFRKRLFEAAQCRGDKRVFLVSDQVRFVHAHRTDGSVPYFRRYENVVMKTSL